MWFYTNGRKSHVLVDNHFPWHARARCLKFSGAKGNELWCAVAEKCFAKHLGGYVITEGGLSGPRLRDLTGAPAYAWYNGRGLNVDQE